MSAATSVLVVLGIAVGGGLLLYLAVREEGRQRETMPRAEAERAARRDTPDPDRNGRADDRLE